MFFENLVPSNYLLLNFLFFFYIWAGVSLQQLDYNIWIIYEWIGA